MSQQLAWPPQYKVKRHRRARHVRLRASAHSGLEITIPYRFNLQDIPSVLEDHKSWIEKHMAVIQLKPDAPLPKSIYLAAIDEIWAVIYIETPAKIKLMQRPHMKEIVFVGNSENKTVMQMLLLTWVKKQAKLKLPLLLDQISHKMALTYESVTVRSQKTLWGSCTVDKIINLNYKLLLLPDYLAEHVLIHELSHTVHLNHSTRFWQLVAVHDAKWKQHRAALRKADKFIPAWVNNGLGGSSG